MQTVLCQGTVVSLLDDRPIPSDECKIEEIAFHLANMSRFNGGGGSYSVAQHSWLVSHLSPHPYEGLMHDAHEPICSDLPTPVKEVIDHISGNKWFMFEAAIAKRVRRRFALNPELSEATHEADMLARRIEVGFLFSPVVKRRFEARGLEPLYGHPMTPHDIWPADKAYRMFLKRYKEVGAGIP